MVIKKLKKECPFGSNAKYRASLVLQEVNEELIAFKGKEILRTWERSTTVGTGRREFRSVEEKGLCSILL